MPPPTTTRRGPRTKDTDADEYADDNADAEMTTSTRRQKPRAGTVATTDVEDEDKDGDDDRWRRR
jgi:hypothetical protein